MKNKLLILLAIFSMLALISCNKDDSLKQRELDLKQKELELKEKELDANQNKNNSDSIKQSQTTNKTLDEIMKDAKAKFMSQLPKIEKDHNGKLDVLKEYTGDFTGYGKEDVAIFFTLAPPDGGNATIWEGLAFYENTGTDAKVIAGYEPKYSFHFDRISGGKIYITKDQWAKGDPHCCPSIHNPKELTIKEGKVYERDIEY